MNDLNITIELESKMLNDVYKQVRLIKKTNEETIWFFDCDDELIKYHLNK